MGLGLNADINVDISKDGVKVSVKKININDFVIDKVFKKIDKKNKIKKSDNYESNTKDVFEETGPLVIEINT